MANFDGYHSFMDDNGKAYGSFEVFYSNGELGENGESLGEGWYWWNCWPGCLPDSEPFGPFEQSVDAYLDAMGS